MRHFWQNWSSGVVDMSPPTHGHFTVDLQIKSLILSLHLEAAGENSHGKEDYGTCKLQIERRTLGEPSSREAKPLNHCANP